MIMLDERRTLLLSNGADMVGIIDLNEIPADVWNGFPFDVSITVALNPQIMSEIKDGPNRQYYAKYERTNHLLGSLDHHAVRFLGEQGYRTEWLATTNIRIDPETLSTRLLHKTVATQADLGWIGKYALLTTKEFGSSVRITSVLTDAKLPVSGVIDAS